MQRVHVNWLAIASASLVVPTACVGNSDRIRGGGGGLSRQRGGEVYPDAAGGEWE